MPSARGALERDDTVRCGGKSKINSLGDALDMALNCLRVVIDVVWDRMEAGDRFRLLRGFDSELVEVVVSPVDSEENEPRLRNPLPRAHRDIACSITDGIILNLIPLDEDEDEEELVVEDLVAMGLKAKEVDGWTTIGERGSGPL